MALGTGLALLPESAFAFAAARVPAGAATTSLLLLLLLLPAAPACARSTSRTRTAVIRRAADAAREGPAERDHLHVRHVRPQADRRVHVQPGAREMREEVAKLVARGQDARAGLRVLHGEVRQPGAARVADRQGVQPPRVVLPVLVGAVGRGVHRGRCVPLVAQASTQRTPRSRSRETVDDPALRERLDDELRDLD